MGQPWLKPKDRQKATQRSPAPRGATRAKRVGPSPSLAVPELSRPEVVDLELRQRAVRLEDDFLGFCELAREALDGKYYLDLGFPDFDTYAVERLGSSYRTLRRGLAALEAVRRLPPADQAPARQALAELGSHKSGALAPALTPENWRDWVTRASGASVAALQAAVSAALGAKRRGRPAPDDPFLERLIRLLPEDVEDRVRAVFKAGQRQMETSGGVAVFLTMLDVFERDLGDQGVVVEG